MLILQITVVIIENHFSYLLLGMIVKVLCQLHPQGIIAILLNSINFHDLGNQAVPAVPLDYHIGIFHEAINVTVSVSFMHIQNLGISRILAYSEPESYSQSWCPDIFRTRGISRTLSNTCDEELTAVKVVNGYNYFRSILLPRSLFHEINTIRQLLQTQLFYAKKTISHQGESLICLLIYSNKLPFFQLITILVCGSNPPKSHEQSYLNFQQKP